MSRLVEARPRETEEAGAADLSSAEETRTREERLKEYGERVAKYVPAEVLAFYSAAIQLILTRQGAANSQFRFWTAALIGLVAWIATPIWLGRFASDPVTRRANQRMGFAAFAVWAYSFPAGAFVEAKLYDPVIGGLLLLSFSLASGMYQPKK